VWGGGWVGLGGVVDVCTLTVDNAYHHHRTDFPSVLPMGEEMAVYPCPFLL
jgi:hypothetical protein